MREDKSINKYDIEFLGFLQEISERTENYPKGQKLIIDSWLKKLIQPSNSKECKRNRNLYAIKLIDNIINNRLEEPFTHFPGDSKDLQWLSVTKVKSELSKKFFNEISIDRIEEKGWKQYEKSKNRNYNNNNCDDYNENELKEKEDNDFNSKYELDKFKLESIIQVLSKENANRDEIINIQEKELDELKDIITTLEKKAFVIISHQKKKNKTNKNK